MIIIFAIDLWVIELLTWSEAWIWGAKLIFAKSGVANYLQSGNVVTRGHQTGVAAKKLIQLLDL